MADSIEDRIFSRVKARSPAAENLKILSVQQRFLDGSLYTVGFEANNSEGVLSNYINRVYVHGPRIDVYGFDEQLLAIIGETHGRGLLERISDSKVISGVIATSLTLVFCAFSASAIWRGVPLEVPQALSNSVLIVLGFYFGRSFEKIPDTSRD